MEENKTIQITIDKSHLITIGERLYTESIELIRELVNNAYDADATEVKVTIAPDKVIVEDNGTGMDLAGLEQYFNIGSPEKRIHNKSPKFKRDRIGQFGIGKFSILSACSYFEVFTQHKNFAATVIFDKEEWEKTKDKWHLPLKIHEFNPERGEGTTVTLSRMNRTFDIEKVERRISEAVPIKAPQFKVYINGKQIRPKSLSGCKIPFLEGTKFGIVSGEIIILPSSSATIEQPGIECKVKQVTIKRELFGIESWGKDIARIRGEVYADFLPVTTDRSGFVTDSEEYQAFMVVMARVMEMVKGVLNRISDEKENKKVRRALRDAVQRVQHALSRNPDWSPFGAIPEADQTQGIGEAGKVSKLKEKKMTEAKQKKKRKKSGERPAVERLTPNAVIRKIKVGNVGISFCLDHFGHDGAECFSEGSTIFINRDHPLYLREIKKHVTHTMYIARLLTQEISLMKDTRDPRQAYERQSKLLKDAFCD